MTSACELGHLLMELCTCPATGVCRGVEVDGLAGRGLLAAVNVRGLIILSTTRAEGADSDDDFAPPASLEDARELIAEAHRRLHDDDVAACHRALHALRTGFAREGWGQR